ncbi:hypothetical protein H5J22_12085 [Cetobacterium sp. 8H]|uniref:hypothetical protein n=1 Tax=Cetobacterium sp. 8H TaxID=2759681 RepID=UPI00163C2294|nr:hypothetical protein [Cetobacterium sp. 8H]MBC2852138.1 hypothetical protein [Cetobacterium sp. 8H]
MPFLTLTNTGEVVKNQFFLISLTDDFHYSTLNKDEKINYILNFNLKHFPTFLREDLVNIETEQELEKHRLNFFPHLPSRCSSQFIFEKLSDLLTASKIYDWKGHIHKISIDTSYDYIISKHNTNLISNLRKSDFKSITNILNEYWNGKIKWERCHDRDFYFLPTTEFLIEGKINIIETLNEII